MGCILWLAGRHEWVAFHELVTVHGLQVGMNALLYPRHLCRRVYSFRLSVRPFVCSFVRSFVRSYFRHVCRICVKVLRQSFSSGVYLSNYLSESIHIWTIVTLEGWHSLYDPEPQGPCPGVGLEVKI